MRTEKDFWARVKKGGKNDCWPWTAVRGKLKEGDRGAVFWFDKCTKPPRLAFALYHQRKLEDLKLCICHHCDNPPCCNPAHLFEGTKADNNLDMRKKGRGCNPPNRKGVRFFFFPEAHLPLLGTMPDYKLAEQINLTKCQVARERKRRGILSYATTSGNDGKYKLGHYPTRWLKKEVAK